jgi:enoyl-CoA hydratase/carnithine racemase
VVERGLVSPVEPGGLQPAVVNYRPDTASVQHRVEVVDLDGVPAAAVARLAQEIGLQPGVVIGLTAAADTAPAALLDAVTVTYTGEPSDDRRVVAVADPAAVAADIGNAVAQAPMAAAVLHQLLRATASISVIDALAMESMAYSMLLAGPEFGRWLARRPAHTSRAIQANVLVRREAGDVLHVTLDEPGRRNPFSAAMRDQLHDALMIAVADPALRIVLDGSGPNFCSGGDLSEFGTAPDPAIAHVIRVERSVGALLARLADRTTVVVHGACVGAGLELPGFAGEVIADAGATFRLPEVAMGLIPGAGGTVSLARRIGRWRLAHLALSGAAISADQACRWGAVDRVTSGSNGPDGAPARR